MRGVLWVSSVGLGSLLQCIQHDRRYDREESELRITHAQHD